MTAFFQSLGLSYEWAWFAATLSGILLIALPVMLAVALIIYADRKIWAAMALRRGPNAPSPRPGEMRRCRPAPYRATASP